MEDVQMPVKVELLRAGELTPSARYAHLGLSEIWVLHSTDVPRVSLCHGQKAITMMACFLMPPWQPQIKN